MGLTSTNPHILGRNQKFFAKAETTAGTQIKPAATDALDVETTSMSNEIAREPWNVPSDYRDAPENITGKGTAAWSINTWLIPSGTAATEPDCSALLTAGMGENNSGSGSTWVYSLASTQTAGTLSLYRGWGTGTDLEASEAMWGAVVNKTTISLSGGEPPKLAMEGWAQDYAFTGYSTLNGQMSASTTMIVQTADKNKFNAGSLISIGSNDDILVTVASSAPSFTVDTSTSSADASVVNPYLPAPTTNGSPISGVLGSLTLHDGDSALATKITGFEVSINSNIMPFDDEVFQQYPSDGIPDWRTVEGTVSFRASREYLRHFANVKEFATRAIVVTCGDTAGSRWVISIPYAEIKFSELSVPADREGTITLPWVAMPSSGNDSITISHT